MVDVLIAALQQYKQASARVADTTSLAIPRGTTERRHLQ